VVQFFGRYVGSVKRAGFHWTVPLVDRTRVSLRVRNFETEQLKVAVDDHVQYVATQAEAAVRHMATSYSYEAHDSGRASLRDSTVVSHELTS
jgi:hypothetical protein